MKIWILDRDRYKTEVLKRMFAKEAVEIVCDDFHSFMTTHDAECVVSPANAYGLMDGGYDAAITEWFGEELQKRVQRYILEHFYGEQPVGTSFLLEIGNGKTLIHTPTMRVPEKIVDPCVVYQCMRTTLMTAIEHGVKSIVIPVFGGATGEVDAETAAKMMWMGYDRIMRPNTVIDWETVWGIDDRWIDLLKKRIAD